MVVLCLNFYAFRYSQGYQISPSQKLKYLPSLSQNGVCVS